MPLSLSGTVVNGPIHTRVGLVQLRQQVLPVRRMQTTLQLLYHYHLAHHQIHVLQA
jgi:hypothetical protein